MKKCKWKTLRDIGFGDMGEYCAKKKVDIHISICKEVIHSENGTTALMGKGTCDDCELFEQATCEDCKYYINEECTSKYVKRTNDIVECFKLKEKV